MNRFRQPFYVRGLKGAAVTVALLTGFLVATVVGIALAKSLALHVAKGAQVTDQSGTTKQENIVVSGRGFAVYTLSGDSKRHPKCTKTNQCFTFWPPVTVSSKKKPSKAAGIRGKLGVWHRDGFFQLTLAGHPLYRYSGDSQRDHAVGEGIKTFGGTWHVIKTKGSAAKTTTPPPSTSTMTTTTPCPYCY